MPVLTNEKEYLEMAIRDMQKKVKELRMIADEAVFSDTPLCNSHKEAKELMDGRVVEVRGNQKNKTANLSHENSFEIKRINEELNTVRRQYTEQRDLLLKL